jgi:CAAX protease family protein
MDGAGPAGGAARSEDGTPLAIPAPGRRVSLPLLLLTVVIAFVAAVALTAVASIALGPRRSVATRSAEEILVLTLATDAGIVLVLATLGRWLLHLRPADLGLRRPSGAALRYAAAFGIALYVASIGINVLQIRVAGAHPQDLVLAFGAHSGLRAYVLDLLNGAVIAPFSEEIFFRGLIFGSLARRMPTAGAAAASALLFALLHGVGVIAPIFVLGLGLAYVYHRTGSVWASMLTHSLVNTVSLTLLFLVPLSSLGD